MPDLTREEMREVLGDTGDERERAQRQIGGARPACAAEAMKERIS